jgi:hypothetical protein
MPPIDFAHRSEYNTSSAHNKEGVLIVSPENIPSLTFLFVASLNIFGIGQLGV